MIPRYLVQLDAKRPTAVSPGDLVSSHPMDRVSARLLCDPQVVKATAARSAKYRKKRTDPALFRDGIRYLQDYRWLGERDRRLWNWIEVKDRDATAEDLAATLWGSADESQQAFGITASPPFFRIEPGWARLFDEAKMYMPGGFDKPYEDNALALAESGFATDAAIAQAADERKLDPRGLPLPADHTRLAMLLERSARQIDRVKELLIPWKLRELVLPALHWVARYRAHLLAISDARLGALAPVIEGQQAILFEAVGSIQEVFDAAGRAAGLDGDHGPFAKVVRHYAIAIGESHLIDTARAQLAIAREAKAGMALAAMDRSLRESDAEVRDLKATEGTQHYGSAEAGAAYATYQRQLVELRGKHAAGQAIDDGEVDLLAANLREHALETRTKSLYLMLSNLQNEARDAGLGTVEVIAANLDQVSPVFRPDFKELPKILGPIITQLNLWIAERARSKYDRPKRVGPEDKRSQAAAKHESIRSEEQDLASFVEQHRIKHIVTHALKAIENQRVRTIVVQVALLIGVSIAGNIAGSVIAGAVRGALLADAAVASVGMLRAARAAQAAGTIAGLATDAGVNAVGQVAIMGGSGSDVFLDNLAANAAVRVALAPLHKVAAVWGAAERDLSRLNVWQKGGRHAAITMRAGAVLTADMITGAAVNYVVHRARHRGTPPDDQTAGSWALQGASMAVGAFIGHKLKNVEARLVQLAEHGAHLHQRAKRLGATARRVQQTGDKDAAMELLVAHHDLLAKEADLLTQIRRAHPPDVKLGQSLSTLEAGNRAEGGGIRDRAFATMPLRLAGLTPDDASGRTWTGASEDIAIGLDQANRAGLSVQVLDHDMAARKWRIQLEGRELTILETRLAGRPRPAKSKVTDADRAHARRYANAADFMQARWEAKVKADLESRAVVDIDHLQVGYGLSGVMNQATLPATGEALGTKLIVYEHQGSLSSRGKQELGQHSKKWDGPGVRGSEQAGKDAEWIKSEEHKRSLDIGRIEVQTPAYRGAVIALQRRPKRALTQADGWAAPHRTLRAQVRSTSGKLRWFYTDRIDNTGGMGTGDLSQLTSKQGGRRAVVDPAQLEPMLSRNQLLRGEDPDYAKKVKQGNILVWGGTATGAWAAEAAVHAPESHITLMGDTRPPRTDWPTLVAEYEGVMHEIQAVRSATVPAELTTRKQALESLIANAHGGMALRRNRKAGAAYAKPIGAGGGRTKVAFGTPTKLVPLASGKVEVTIGTGPDAITSIYDQVVIAHGQDPNAPGAPGRLLGPGAAPVSGSSPDREYGDVPAGTIALRPIYGPAKPGAAREVLGLESIDPPGIRLLGAAYASKKLSRWVIATERDGFEQAIDRLAAPHAQTRDHGVISDDSTKVTTGIEVQRDKLPRANEVLAAQAYRLPGPKRTLQLDPNDRSRWDEQVRDFFVVELRAEGRWVRVKRLGGGKSAAVVYLVTIDDMDVGVFKLFDDKHGAANETEMLDLLRNAKLKSMTVVRGRGRIAVDPASGFHGGVLMDKAHGTTIRDLIESVPKTNRDAAIEQLRHAMVRAARGLAEMHESFGTKTMGKPVLMTVEAKRNDANYFLNKSFRSGDQVTRVKAALGADFERVKAKLEGPLLAELEAADVPATAYHGDANAGNLLVDKYDHRLGYKDLAMIDVGSMKWSVENGRGTKTGAADVARFLGSLETFAPGNLTTTEVRALRKAFLKSYFVNYAAHQRVDRVAYARAERWFRIEMEVAVLKSDPTAKARILHLLELETRP
ncbi:MAG: hypothetical protein WKG01_14230 [Kofleriaceae bacterium]